MAYNISSYKNFENLFNDENIRGFSDITNTRFTVMDKSGIVRYESEAKEELKNHGNRPEIKGAMKGNTSVNIRTSKTLDVDMMYAAVPIIIDERVVGVVRNAVSLDSLHVITNQIIKDILKTIIITISFSIIAFYYLTKGILKPLGETTEFAKEIADGNYKKRLSMFREDEIGSLTNSLNHMAEQLEYSFNELSQRNSQLESVLSNVKNGIIAINDKHEIILINDSAYTMLNLSKDKKPLGKNILEAIRNQDFYRIITELSGKKDIHFFETELNDNVYSMYIKQIIDNNATKGYIIVIEDITQIRKLEDIRKDFVANVTHELKTPITSIKGFVETLLSGDVKDEEIRVKFYHIIESEVNRLIRLVEDILTLSSLDSQPNDYEVESIDVRAHIKQLFYLMEKTAKNKEIQLSFNIDEKIKNIVFNRNYFKQMMINLIDNAIKYNEIKGYVKVNVYPKGKTVLIEVIDNGFGIPSKDLPRIFERFYRVDKGRSRQAGGTGLGLAIVKHMVQIQKSQIRVQSKLGEGTKFTITIPM